jgi:iron complex transport system ATP-binding protein
MSQEALVRVERVSFAFSGAARDAAPPVVSELSLTIDRPGLVCVLGMSGAGKTTLIRLVAGLLSPTAGTVRVAGRDPGRGSRRELARVLAYLPQSYDLAVPFSLLEVVLMGRYPHQQGPFGLDSEADVATARAAMERCDVGHLAGRRFDEVSGGEQRRALLAQALCQEARLLLLDEPTASLDPFHAIAVFEALRAEAARGVAALVVTHDVNLAARFADRLIVVEGGRVVADGAADEVLAAQATSAAFRVALHSGVLPGSAVRFAVPY